MLGLPDRLGSQLGEAIPEIIEAYRRDLTEAANPLGTTPELWEESRAHAVLMLQACAQVIDLPEGTPQEHKPGADLLSVSAMGALWACCRARLTDSLSAMEALVRITFDKAVLLAEQFPAARRAALIARAGRVINEISSLHARAAALSYDRYLLRQIEQANAEDRTRLARDIHDRLGNSLVLAFRHLEIYRARLSAGLDTGDQHITAIQQSLEEATAFTRGLINGLRAEAPLTSLSEALAGCAGKLNFRKLPVHIAVDGDETWLPAHHREELFLVLREFLRNSFAHAEPTSIGVQVGISPHRVDVEAYDDGRGFVLPDGREDPARVPGRRRGSGLIGMRERVEDLGGLFSLSSAPGEGTRMRLWVPLPKGAREAGRDGAAPDRALTLSIREE